MLYTHIHADVSRNIMTRFNEQTNTLLYKNIPLTLYSRKGCERVVIGYVWEVSWRRRETATYWPQVPLTIAALLLQSAWVLRAQALCLELVLTPASYLQLELQLELQLTQAVCGTWLYNCLPVDVRICTEFNHVHRSRWYSDIFDRMGLFPLFLCLFTQVHLLIDGSVEGQYVTQVLGPNQRTLKSYGKRE